MSGNLLFDWLLSSPLVALVSHECWEDEILVVKAPAMPCLPYIDLMNHQCACMICTMQGESERGKSESESESSVKIR